MAAKKKRKPRGIIERYAEAVARGENPDPPMFFGLGDDESLDAFVERVWAAMNGCPTTSGDRAATQGDADRCKGESNGGELRSL